MGLDGTWENSYGSFMTLTSYDTGLVLGNYKSDTGSSGVYLVVGHADPAPDAGKGQAVALSIYWRSIAGGTPNPTWHYVSGFSGQLIDVNGTPSLVLLHAMVDSDDQPGPGGLGTYLDKLTYTPASSKVDLGAMDKLPEADTTGDPICGAWAGVAAYGPALEVDVLSTDPETGLVLATITPPGEGGTELAALGFTDTTAVTDGLALQSLSLSAFNEQDGTVWSLAGCLELSTGTLTLLQMQSHGTAPGNMYAQTTATQFVLKKTA